ncbi:MAG: hypothetical protein ACXWNE_02855, partial [Candidatus Binataceae bacterium]
MAGSCAAHESLQPFYCTARTASRISARDGVSDDPGRVFSVAIQVLTEFTLLRTIQTAACAFIAALVVGGGSAARAESAYSFAAAPGRLPKNVVPTHYAIDLKPDLITRAVPGSEIVDIKVLAPTDRLVLNALDMVVQSASLEG